MEWALPGPGLLQNNLFTINIYDNYVSDTTHSLLTNNNICLLQNKNATMLLKGLKPIMATLSWDILNPFDIFHTVSSSKFTKLYEYLKIKYNYLYNTL